MENMIQIDKRSFGVAQPPISNWLGKICHSATPKSHVGVFPLTSWCLLAAGLMLYLLAAH